MRGFWSIAAKELLHIRRDVTILIFALIVPCIQITILGYAFDFDVRHLPASVADYDNSQASRELVQKLVNTQYVRIVSYEASQERAVQKVRSGKARLAIVIPPDFGRRHSALVMLDGSDSQVASRAAAALRGEPATGGNDLHVSILYNPGGKTSLFTIPGLIGVIVQLISIVLTSLSLVREREQGTLEQLMVTPVGRAGLMLGKMAPYAILAFAEMLAVLFFAWLLFDIRIAGSFWQLLFMTIPFLLSTLALGLLISTIATNQSQALQMVVVVMVPSILLSGFVFPLDNMPLPLYLLSQVIPATHYMEILRGTIIRGIGLTELYKQTFILWGMAIFLIVLSSLRFRKSVS